tara:strand:+ start:132 stop:470 length:339 start_codon:yes stop_codon:yes gene_type:complete
MRALSVGSNPTAATLTTLYTVPTGYYAKVTLLRATNSTASNKHVSFDWIDTSASITYPIVYQQTVASKTMQDFGSSIDYFVMEEGDILKVTTESASTFGIIATFEQEGLTRI